MQVSDSSSRILAGLLEARTGQQLTMSRRWRIETALAALLRERGIPTLDELITILVMGREPSLATQVVASGAVVTESSMDQEPLKGLFPARNRIISGLSRVVVIVQAPARSGALITAEHTADQGRTVMAVPGPIDDEACGGCNALIRDGAALCRGVEDVLEELDGVSAVATRATAEMSSAGPAGLDETQQRLWEALGDGSRSIDELAQTLGLAAPALSGMLLMLQMKKVVRQLPGNRYERC